MGKKLIILIAAILGLVFFGKLSDADESPIAENQRQKPGVQSRDFSASVAGIDANNDGVRDDIEAFIIKKYPDPAQRVAMLQVAKTTNSLLLANTKDKKELSKTVAIHFRAVDCLKQRIEKKVAYTKANEILAMTLNTEARWRAYANFMSIGGYVVLGTRPGDIVCDDELNQGN